MTGLFICATFGKPDGIRFVLFFSELTIQAKLTEL